MPFCTGRSFLLIALAGLGPTSTPAAEAELHRRQASELSRFGARLEPMDGQPKVREFQHWLLRLEDADGPVERAGIRIAGGMQDHGHGLPSQPVVTA